MVTFPLFCLKKVFIQLVHICEKLFNKNCLYLHKVFFFLYFVPCPCKIKLVLHGIREIYYKTRIILGGQGRN